MSSIWKSILRGFLDFYIVGKKFKQKPFQGPISNGRDAKNCPALLSSPQLLNNAENAVVRQMAEAALFVKILFVTEE
jgi:hypothetical protein